LQVKNCFPLFRSKFLLTCDEVESIESKRVTSRMTQKLLDILMTKDVKLAFETIYEFVSQRSYQGWLGQALRASLKEAKIDNYSPQTQTRVPEGKFYQYY
jgi:hypothetical protein